MNNTQLFDEGVFSSTLCSLLNEYNILDNNKKVLNNTKFAGVVLHFPKHWVDVDRVQIDSIRYDYSTENTIEIEVDWKDPITKQTIKFTALQMKES